MNTLFLYFSHSGSGDAVAAYLEEKGVTIRKVEPVRRLPKSFFWSVMTGGFLATIGHRSKLKDFDKDFGSFDRIVIGSPVWNGRISCPINELLASTSFGEKSLFFLLYAGGGEAPKAVQRISEEYPNAGVLVLKEPKKHPEELEKTQVLFD